MNPVLDAHQQPPDELRAEWKAFSRLDAVDDAPVDETRDLHTAGVIGRAQLSRAFEHLGHGCAAHAQADVPILFHPLLPGLLVVPGLVPGEIQKVLLAKMLHRDLSNPQHQTNMHLHYTLPYPDSSSSSSFFSLAPSSSSARFVPKDPAVHKALTPAQVLNRRLHWLTLGGQYDWTNRTYPDGEPPRFPTDLAGFLGALFPDTLPQAAIVNLYSPGDSMMMHRDVSEDSDKGLVSLSFGCDGLFMIAPGEPAHRDGDDDEEKEEAEQEERKKFLLLRLRSGDAIYMTREARHAWHGVPKIINDTCPAYLENWPAGDDGGGGEYADWQGWIKKKRINLNVRQMTI